MTIMAAFPTWTTNGICERFRDLILELIVVSKRYAYRVRRYFAGVCPVAFLKAV